MIFYLFLICLILYLNMERVSTFRVLGPIVTSYTFIDLPGAKHETPPNVVVTSSKTNGYSGYHAHIFWLSLHSHM